MRREQVNFRLTEEQELFGATIADTVDRNGA
jgi:hypothetical protein